VELADAGPTGEVVGPHGRAQGAGQPGGHDAGAAREHGQQEGQDLDQVGGVDHEPAALVEGLVHQADLTLLEVAETAVDHLGGLGGRARCEVVALDEGGAQPSAGGIEGAAGAGDATPR